MARLREARAAHVWGMPEVDWKGGFSRIRWRVWQRGHAAAAEGLCDDPNPRKVLRDNLPLLFNAHPFRSLDRVVPPALLREHVAP